MNIKEMETVLDHVEETVKEIRLMIDENKIKSPKVVFISGPISGVSDYWTKFAYAEDYLLDQGYIVLNPAHLPSSLSEDKAMAIAFEMLKQADMLYLLKGWGNSNGCAAEVAYAQKINMPISFPNEREEEDDD